MPELYDQMKELDQQQIMCDFTISEDDDTKCPNQALICWLESDMYLCWRHTLEVVLKHLGNVGVE